LNPTKPMNTKIPSFVDSNKLRNFYSIEELKQTFFFIENYVHMGLTKAHDAYKELTPNSKTFLHEYLLYNLDCLPKNLKFITLSGNFKKNKKRNEEINKTIYKSALKRLRKQFKYEHCNFVTQSQGTKLYKYAKNAKVGFYIWMFQDTIINNREHVDFVLDVCFETYGTKSREFSREMGWRKRNTKKFVAIKNISATFRYLVKRDEPCRNQFLDFFQSNGENGLLGIYKNKIRKNLNEKFNKFKTQLISVKNNFKLFILKIQDVMADKNYKSPWMLESIKNSISYCSIELEEEYLEAKKKGKYRDISKEYQKMKHLHYTS
jgi:hypothetical protein